jgi:hypothetical protein
MAKQNVTIAHFAQLERKKSGSNHGRCFTKREGQRKWWNNSIWLDSSEHLWVAPFPSNYWAEDFDLMATFAKPISLL